MDAGPPSSDPAIATSAAIGVRLVQRLLVVQPWVCRWVEFRVDPVR